MERPVLPALSAISSGLEIRADLIGDPRVDLLRDQVKGELTYSLRSAQHGGAYTGGAAERAYRLIEAAREYDLVDLEYDRDLTPGVLAAVPPRQRRISWHGRGSGPAGLASLFTRMAATPARLYLLAPVAENLGQVMAPLRFLDGAGRADVTAFATGELGVCSRLLAPWLGAPVVFGGLGTAEDAAHAGEAGLPAVEHLLADFPFPRLPALRHVFAIVGPPGRWSRSPRLHNTALAHLGLPALFVPAPALEFPRSWRALRTGFDHLGLPVEGATVVAPFKEDALRLADEASQEAAITGAANLLVRRGRRWRAHTTDPAGVVGALRRAGVRVAGRRAAVVGCGGAGRGAAAGLLAAGAYPTIVNRGRDRGRFAARLLGVGHVSLREFRPQDYELVVHATPIRTDPPFDVSRVADDAVVVDLAYGPQETGLVGAARRRGLALVDGWGVLAVEIAQQFRRMTGRELPSLADPARPGSFAASARREYAV
jgi:3-dehydroquinate dehydratase/shikimate dehydrogenase